MTAPRRRVRSALSKLRRQPGLLAAGLLGLVLAVAAVGADDTRQPIRPGEPGKAPFWNQHARRFIWAPAFEFAAVPEAREYRFTVMPAGGAAALTFTADAPWRPLSPIWTDLPAGKAVVKVEAVGANGSVPVGERSFVKSPAFSGATGTPAYTFADSGLRCLRDLLRQRKVASWITEGQPDVFYPKWIYPGLMALATVQGMATLAQHTTDAKERAEAILVARRAADFLMSLREPAGTPLAGWPRTYWEGAQQDIQPAFKDQIMSTSPAESARAYLDLYDLTGEAAYLGFATGVADTLVRCQLANGTWPLWLERATGRAKEPAMVVPVAALRLFNRLISQYGRGEYAAARDRAMKYCVDGPLRTMCWDAQFEDTRPKDAYRNQSHREPALMAELLFQRNAPGDVAQAEELLRWVEDGFVVWDASDAVARERLFKPGSRWSGLDPDFGLDWFLPAAVEQYAFFTPLDSSSADLIEAWLAGYKATGRRDYLAKAVALATTLTVAQRYFGGGEIPTHLRQVQPELNWLNCSVEAADTLLRHAPELQAYFSSASAPH
jgi:maltose/maltodextrin transport system substrate-binding protein